MSSFQKAGFVSGLLVGAAAASTLSMNSRSRSLVRQSTSASSSAPSTVSQQAR
jgi:hypothetical protein